MSGTTPTTLGKYQIIREIARSNDIVYEAYDPLMNRRIALKELAMPSGASDAQRDDRIRRFSREAKAAGSLNHPNIVTIFEFGEDSGRHFIAMEFLEGHNLRNELDTHGFLAADRAIEITLEVLDALDYAHKNGVIHRDIKPENIQLLPDGRVKLTDFGIARITFEPNLTIDGQVFGTPSYMSPEQVVGREIDARSDVFGVGVILYEMLSGQKPFQGDSVVSITYGIVKSKTAAANIVPPEIYMRQELRDIDQKLVKRLVKATYKLADKVAAEHRLAVTHEHISGNTAALMAPRVQDTIEGAAKALGLGSYRMPSGAGHDAQVMARVAEAGMIFVPSEGGRSHRRDEWTDWRLLEQGANVLLQSVLRLMHA